ncbi:MAG: superoxide dismutase family protein [bacterium]
MLARSVAFGIVVAGVALFAMVMLFGLTAFAADPAYNGSAVKTITASLQDGTGAAIGAVQVSEDANGVVQLTVSGTGLSAGEHGIHVHATGKCDGPAFATANAHFNVTSHQHGLDNPAGPHEGDLPGLTAAANGTFSYTATTNRISLTGGATNIFDADGSALIIHAGKDDQVTDPTGNSGGRVACAVLAAASTAPLPPNTGNAAPNENSSRFGLLGLVLCASAIGAGGFQLARRRKLGRFE